jgi:plastocyanin
MLSRCAAILAGLGLLQGQAAVAQTAAAAVEHRITIEAMQFEPGELVVHTGDRIVWSNKDLLPHSARADSGSFDSGLIKPTESWTFAPDRPGMYPYGCAYHPGMKASIRVLP